MRTAYLGRSAAALAVVCACAATAGGCKKSSDSSTSGGADDRQLAHDYYVQHVHPAIANCIGCHKLGGAGPVFMAVAAEDSYGALENTAGLIVAPKNSPLVIWMHKDPTIVISPEQRSVVTTWLGLEASARGLAGAAAKPKSVTDAYTQFAQCMDPDAWDFFRMGDLAFTETDREGPCLGCHSTGQGSAFMAADSRATFDHAKQFPFIQKLVVGKLDGRGSFENLQPSGRFAEKANEVCPPGSTSCHPRFGLPPAITDAIDHFVQKTLEDLASGTCRSIVVPVGEGGVDAGDGG
jgi:hypothetical protein